MVSVNFRKFFSVSCEVLVWHGFHEWRELVPRQRVGDCSEIHVLRWGLCALLLPTKSPSMNTVLPFFVSPLLKHHLPNLSSLPCCANSVRAVFVGVLFTCQILRNCQCKWLLVSSSAAGTSLGSSVVPEKLLFCTGRIVTTELPNLVPQQRIDDWSCHQNVLLWAWRYQHFFCEKPRFFFVFQQISQFGSFGKCVQTLCLPEPGSTFARDSIGDSWEELEVSSFLGRVSRGSVRLRSSTKFSLKSCSHSSKSYNRSLCTFSSSSFLVLFSVSVGSCSGFPHSSSLVLPPLSCTGFSVCWHQIRNHVMKKMMK